MQPATAPRDLPSPPGRLDDHRAAWAANDTRPVAARWREAGPAQLCLETGPDYVFIVSLSATRLELRAGGAALFDGWMKPGTVLAVTPGRRLVATLSSPCDLLHLYAPALLLQTRRPPASEGGGGPAPADMNGRTFCDPLAGQLAQVLLSDAAQVDAEYAEAVRQTLLTRLIHVAHAQPRALPLPKWRLRRVQALVDLRLDEPLTLSELAAEAGLSRMHFAAQFRAATGCSPHAYLLSRRIEAAKTLLAEGDTALVQVALRVGFLAQSHFTTVFKRLTGETPGRWRRANRLAPGDQRPA